MLVTCVINSTLRLLLEPQSDLERSVLKEMAERSEKGTTTVLALPQEGSQEFTLVVGGKE